MRRHGVERCYVNNGLGGSLAIRENLACSTTTQSHRELLAQSAIMAAREGQKTHRRILGEGKYTLHAKKKRTLDIQKYRYGG